jgi:hypothetical protein
MVGSSVGMGGLVLALAALAAAVAAGTDVVVGTARTAKGRAVVVKPDGGHVTMLGLEAWPDGVDGLSVRATGTLGEARVLPEARQLPDGARTQGVAPGSDPDTVLSDASWALVDPVAGPWTLAISDGSGNTWTVRRVEAGGVVAWAYDPVRPEESSSGTYSGGDPGEGRLDDAATRALWAAVSALEADPTQRVPSRVKGSGRVVIASPTGERTLLVPGGSGFDSVVRNLPRP